MASSVIGCVQPYGCGDVAGPNFLDFLAVVRVHLQDAADALLAALDRVQDRIAGIQDAGVDAEKRQVADERVRRNLECQRRERLRVVRGALAFGLVLVDALDRRNVDRRRHEVDDCVEHRLHALVLERRAAHRNDDLAG
jgi:hypothetical protein